MSNDTVLRGYVNDLINGVELPKGCYFKIDEDVVGYDLAINYYYVKTLLHTLYIGYADNMYIAFTRNYKTMPGYSNRYSRVYLDTILEDINTLFQDIVSENDRINTFISSKKIMSKVYKSLNIKKSMYKFTLRDDNIEISVGKGIVHINYRIADNDLCDDISKGISWLESGKLLNWLEEYRLLKESFNRYYEGYVQIINKLMDQRQSVYDSSLNELKNY